MNAVDSTHSAALKATRVLRRGLWIILASTALVTAIAVYMAMREPDRFQATSQVLLKYDTLAPGLAGVQGVIFQDPTRTASTQTQIAMSPAVARRVAARRPLGTPEIGGISVQSVTGSDILLFTSVWRDAPGAVALANEYARQYVAYRRTLDTQAVVHAQKELDARITQLEAADVPRRSLIDRLDEQKEQLRTYTALSTANAVVLRPALGAVQTQPKPRRAAVLGIVLGLMLGVALAFARDALDTRVKSAGEIGERLGLQLLGRVPTPPRSLRSKNRLVMLSNRTGGQAEAFRILRTNLSLANLDTGARSIMFTSAIEQEGKSTIVANLAVAYMRAGRRVALVDLDLRRPSLARFFGLPADAPGVSTVAAGNASLRSALHHVLGGELDASEGATAPGARPQGSLTLVPSGAAPPDPGELIATARLPELLRQLADDYDLVLVDTPPLLSVGDTMALAPAIDAAVVVARLGLTRRATLDEMRRALSSCPCVKLGFVASGAETEETYGAGGFSDYDYSYLRDSAREEQSLA